MPRARTRSGSSKNVAASSSTSGPVAPPLLDGLLGQMHISASPTASNRPSTQSTWQLNKQTNDSKSAWQCNDDDWSDDRAATTAFPLSLRAIEQQNERAQDKLFRFIPKTIHEHQDNVITEHRTKLDTPIDVSELSSIVNDLITGKRDQAAYTAFLAILQHFSARSPRDDHLEETVYHLIQAAITFIRANEQRFDPSQLQDCYRRRHARKTMA
jgi:hypothetical protein